MVGATKADRTSNNASRGRPRPHKLGRNWAICCHSSSGLLLRHRLAYQRPSGRERSGARHGRGWRALIVTASTPATRNRNQIVSLAAKHRLPAVYPAHLFVMGGGLLSYGPGRLDQYRLAATYLDRVLKGRIRPICRCRCQPNTSLLSI